MRSALGRLHSLLQYVWLIRVDIRVQVVVFMLVDFVDAPCLGGLAVGCALRAALSCLDGVCTVPMLERRARAGTFAVRVEPLCP